MSRHLLFTALVPLLAGFLLPAACSNAPKGKSESAPEAKTARTAEDHLPSLKSHMAAGWIGAAIRLQGARAAVIYYRGSARRASAAGEPWMGTVEGDILFVSPEEAVLIPKGTLTLGPENAIKTTGPARTLLATPGKDPEWRALLPI